MKALDMGLAKSFYECDECQKRRYSEHLPNNWISVSVKGKERTWCCWKHCVEWMEVNG